VSRGRYGISRYPFGTIRYLHKIPQLVLIRTVLHVRLNPLTPMLRLQWTIPSVGTETASALSATERLQLCNGAQTMSARSSPEFRTWRLPDNLDLQMLRTAQAYLQCRDRHQIPSAADGQAWNWFYQTYDPLLRRWVMGCHIALDNVEDCLQEVWIEVMRKLPAFVSDGTQRGLCSWLRAIARAKVVDVRRYQSRYATRQLGAHTEAVLVSREVGPAADNERRDRQDKVQRVLVLLRGRVSELTFHAFHERWVEGHTMKQIATELHETRRKVSCRVYKAKQKFRLLCNQLALKDILTHG
jgi:RNA polymerase sigma-70 factor (ECF subfamily)